MTNRSASSPSADPASVTISSRWRSPPTRSRNASVPGLRMIAVAGPRIDPGSLPRHPGLEVHGYVDRLYRHLAVCDLAIVQGGLTTTMELTACKRPFIYFPLIHHFEQNFHVRHRLDRYGAGVHLDYDDFHPDRVADLVSALIDRATITVRRRDGWRCQGRSTDLRALL